MKTMNMLDLKDVVATHHSDCVILDVRTKAEYSEGHVPGSVNIPVEELFERYGEVGQYKEVYVHCARGGRAQQAALILKDHGEFDEIHVVVESGMPDWITAGYKYE